MFDDGGSFIPPEPCRDPCCESEHEHNRSDPRGESPNFPLPNGKHNATSDSND